MVSKDAHPCPSSMPKTTKPIRKKTKVYMLMAMLDDGPLHTCLASFTNERHVPSTICQFCPGYIDLLKLVSGQAFTNAADHS